MSTSGSGAAGVASGAYEYGSPVYLDEVSAAALASASTNGPVYGGIRIDTDGDFYKYNPAGTSTSLFTWLNLYTASDYYIYVTVVAGTLTYTSSPTDSWIQLNTDRFYRLEETVAGNTDSVTIQVQIRKGTSGGAIAVQTYNPSAEYVNL